MSNTASMKQGDCFAINWEWTPGDSGPANLLGVTIASSIRVCGNVLPLDVTIAEDGLSFSTVYPDSTADWAVGTWPFDIRFEFEEGKSHSITFRLIVSESIAL